MGEGVGVADGEEESKEDQSGRRPGGGMRRGEEQRGSRSNEKMRLSEE